MREENIVKSNDEKESLKQLYMSFCEKIYTPIFSQPWWLDVMCGEGNWDVWLYIKGTTVLAAMPYYLEKRGDYRYITKAPLTQNNGLLILYPLNQKQVARAHFEEEIACAADQYIQSLGVDVYEQQFHYGYTNFLPFFWNGYTSIPRVTYVIENTRDMNSVEKHISSKYRSVIRKGRRSIARFSSISPEKFFYEHEKIFLRQKKQSPISFSTWMKLFGVCDNRNAGQILAAQAEDGTILSLAFFVWDSESVYLLLGGPVPEYATLDTFDALVYEGIMLASKKGLKFDFEGSVIRAINHSFREYGGEAKLYFRIRKIFNPAIIRAEADAVINNMKERQLKEMERD